MRDFHDIATRKDHPMRQSKATRSTPETASQALTWDRKKRQYLQAGFCDRCAAQAAWGHQLGFSNAKPVCRSCDGRSVPGSAGARAARWAAGCTDGATT